MCVQYSVCMSIKVKFVCKMSMCAFYESVGLISLSLLQNKVFSFHDQRRFIMAQNSIIKY